MEPETKFAPQWLQAKQQSNSSNGPSRSDGRFFTGGGGGKDFNRNNGNSAGSNSTVKYQLAEHRYGREEMLALYDPSNEAPDDLKDLPIFISDSLNPISLAPMTEEEEALSLHNHGNYGYKSYQRGGISRGGLRGEYGGRGRGRGHDEGRLRPRDAWDDRPTKSHDYPSLGYDEGQTSSHKTDFYSPSSHHNSFNRSNSNESWRSSRGNFQDADGGDFRRDRWGSNNNKNWREGKSETKEEGTFFRAMANKDSKTPDFRRSKSLFEEDESGQKVPEWSTVNDDDLGVEGSFDSSGAFMTSRLKQEQNKVTSDPQTTGNVQSVSREETGKSSPGKESKDLPLHSPPKTSTDSNPTNPATPVQQVDKSKPLATNQFTSAPIKSSPPENILPTTTQIVSFKIEDHGVCANVSLNSSLRTLEPVVATPFTHSNVQHGVASPFIHSNVQPVVASPFIHSNVQPVSLPAAEPSMMVPHLSLLSNQQFNYVRNTWYYVDPQGSTQGPFKDSDMTEWYYQGYFDMSLMLKAGEAGEFMSLGSFTTKVGFLPFVQSRPGPMINPMMQVMPTPSTQSMSQTPRSLLSNIQYPVSTLNQDTLPQPYFYHQQLEQPQQVHLQHPLQATSSFLPNLPRNTSDNLFATEPTHMPSLNGDISDKMPWLQTVLQMKESGPADLGLTQEMLSQGTWCSGINSSSNVSVRFTDYAGAVQPKPSSNPQQSEKMEAEKLRAEREKKEQMEMQRMRDEIDREQMKMLHEMIEENLIKMQDEKRKELQEKAKLEELQRLEEEERARKELEEMRRMDEEAKRQEQLLLEAQRQLELQQLESLQRDEDFKPVDDSKKSKESKKNKKEAKKMEEAKKQEEERQRQEESRRQEMLQKLEEQKKAEELKRKEEEEQVRKFKEVAEEAKRMELEELNQRKMAKNVWTSNQSKPNVTKMNDIQSIEQEKMRQHQQITEQKLITDQQKHMAAISKLSGGNIWSNVAKTPVPKSLLDIQMEQASQLDATVKPPQQPPIAKVSEVPFGKTRSSGTKEVAKATPIIQPLTQANKDAVWEASGSSSIKWMQKPPSLDNNQFPALSGKGATAKKLASKALGRAEIAAQKIFESVKVKDELTEWCEGTLSGLKTDVDISTLVDFLRTIKNPSDVVDYIHSYLGDSKQVKEFAKQFIERSIPQAQENNAWSVVSRQGNTNSKVQDKSNDKAAKKGKKKQQKDANFLLGFTVHADPDRTNVGEIDTNPPIGLRK